jgi:hypothetical protein
MYYETSILSLWGFYFHTFLYDFSLYALKVSWPPVLQSVLGSLSFVNLNLELVSPEWHLSLPSENYAAFTYYLTLGSPLPHVDLELLVLHVSHLRRYSIDGQSCLQDANCAKSSQIISADRCRPKGTAASYILQALNSGMKFLYLSVATKTFELPQLYSRRI